jgi:hypothetical protein
MYLTRNNVNVSENKNKIVIDLGNHSKKGISLLLLCAISVILMSLYNKCTEWINIMMSLMSNIANTSNR